MTECQFLFAFFSESELRDLSPGLSEVLTLSLFADVAAAWPLSKRGSARWSGCVYRRSGGALEEERPGGKTGEGQEGEKTNI